MRFLELWDHSGCDASTVVSKQSFLTNKVFPIDCFMDEIKPIFNEKLEFETRDESKYLAVFRIERKFIKVPMQRRKPKVFSTECSATRMEFLIQTLIEIIRLVVVEKIDFDIPNISKLITISGKFGLSVLRQRAQNHQFDLD